MNMTWETLNITLIPKQYQWKFPGEIFGGNSERKINCDIKHNWWRSTHWVVLLLWFSSSVAIFFRHCQLWMWYVRKLKFHDLLHNQCCKRHTITNILQNYSKLHIRFMCVYVVLILLCIYASVFFLCVIYMLL